MNDGYRPVPAHVDLTALEKEILDFWSSQGTFERSLEQPPDAPRWTFYEGPPTTNGLPGVHHVEARVFKDLFPRFRTMQGYQVDRKAGWDCHGLPVEVAVERELSLSGKQQIEEYGIAAFNDRCRESVARNVDAFEQMTERMAYWVDTSAAYRTMDASYVQSVWWSLKQVFDAGLLVEDQRVAPYCPRCETTLSDHELAQGYETVADPSVYVRMPLTSGPLSGQAALLVWTTTPWTLVSNTAVAVHPEVEYVVATDGTESLVVAEPLREQSLGEGWTVTERFAGAELERWTYRRPLDLVEFPASTDGGLAHYVVLADYVTTEDGTGLVHQSPAFGADDMQVARAYGLPVVHPVRSDGHFADDVGLVGGQFFKKADEALVRDLEQRGVLLRHDVYEHAYPHCWRCHTPLMYYAMPAWYVRTTQVKDALIRENESTTWYPDTVKHGRFGDWLDNNVDWSLSRTRYWGTPLPIWRNDEDPTQLVCVGSLTELSSLAGCDLSALDPHRPYVDDVTFRMPGVPGVFRREPHVIDAWYDSGAMPFAQWGYPHAPGSVEAFEQAYPAQFICEAIDQTRGWFYTLMAIGTLVFDRSSYENVVCVGHILAEDGRKMSKHLGNILEPIPLMDDHGADALRWFMACSGSPWVARRVGHGVLSEIVRKVLLTYWNTVAFHVLYARTAGWSPDVAAPPVRERPVLDRWLTSQTQALVREVNTALEDFDTQRTGAAIARFVDEVSNWYVRRSRRRFWDGDPAALATLHDTLEVLTRLMAPITPFVTERVWQDVVRPVTPEAPDSVHLASWPSADESLIDPSLNVAVQQARRVVELGRSARAQAKVRTRQPLRRVLVGSAAWRSLSQELRAEVAGELNVGSVDSIAAAGADLVQYSAKANFRTLGKRFGKQTPAVASAIAAADPSRLATALSADGRAEVELDGSPVQVLRDEIVVSEHPVEGWSVVNEHGETVALDLELTTALEREGHAREAIRLIQDARKRSGFEVSDRIDLWYVTHRSEVAEAMSTHADLIAAEVLSGTPLHAEPDQQLQLPAFGDIDDPGFGLLVWVRRR
ncbi:MAG: isoleucine--tRNA ligase [Nocardioidaceae bacterium]|nr:isoleucine--tRNA ligase [Nocardioidaceae bacterium]